MRLEEAAREVYGVTVREMASFGQAQAQDAVTRLHEGKVGGHVGVRTRVRLHVRVFGAKELLRPVDSEPLDLIDELAAAVITLAGIPLSILVGQD